LSLRLKRFDFLSAITHDSISALTEAKAAEVRPSGDTVHARTRTAPSLLQLFRRKIWSVGCLHGHAKTSIVPHRWLAFFAEIIAWIISNILGIRPFKSQWYN
jgi:hypothetical protein